MRPYSPGILCTVITRAGQQEAGTTETAETAEVENQWVGAEVAFTISGQGGIKPRFQRWGEGSLEGEGLNELRMELISHRREAGRRERRVIGCLSNESSRSGDNRRALTVSRDSNEGIGKIIGQF